MFFLCMMIHFVIYSRRTPYPLARRVFKISAFAMLILCVQVVLYFVLVYVHDGAAPSWVVNALTMFEITIVPTLGGVLSTLVGSRAARLRYILSWSGMILLLMALYVAIHSLWIFHLSMFLVLLYGVYILQDSIRGFRRQTRILKEVYSNPESRDVSWMFTFLGLLVLVFLYWFVSHLFEVSIVGHLVYDCVTMILWFGYTLMISHQNLNFFAMHEYERQDDEHPETPGSLVLSNNSSAASSRSSETAAAGRAQAAVAQPEEVRDVLGEAIRKFCEEEQHFKDPELTIIDLARTLGTNRTYVSRWMSAQGMNFSTYINNLRLIYVVELLKDSNVKINDVWMKAGFGTASSFRNVFKNHYGCTPSEYRHMITQGGVNAES